MEGNLYNAGFDALYNSWLNELDVNSFTVDYPSQFLAPVRATTNPSTATISTSPVPAFHHLGDLGERNLLEKEELEEEEEGLEEQKLKKQEDELLRHLKEVEKYSWPKIRTEYRKKTGQNVRQPALEMRYKRLLKYPFTERQVCNSSFSR
jgi:hypothetical protein